MLLPQPQVSSLSSLTATPTFQPPNKRRWFSTRLFPVIYFRVQLSDRQRCETKEQVRANLICDLSGWSCGISSLCNKTCVVQEAQLSVGLVGSWTFRVLLTTLEFFLPAPQSEELVLWHKVTCQHSSSLLITFSISTFQTLGHLISH